MIPSFARLVAPAVLLAGAAPAPGVRIHFVDTADRAGLSHAFPNGGVPQRRAAQGLAVADVENDGRLEALVNSQNEKPAMLAQQGDVTGNWIHLDLEGPRSNRSAIGARVHLRSNSGSHCREVWRAAAACRRTTFALTPDSAKTALPKSETLAERHDPATGVSRGRPGPRDSRTLRRSPTGTSRRQLAAEPLVEARRRGLLA